MRVCAFRSRLVDTEGVEDAALVVWSAFTGCKPFPLRKGYRYGYWHMLMMY